MLMHCTNTVSDPGIAQLVGRHIWEREQTSQHRKIKSAKKPLFMRVFGTFQNLKKA